MSYSKLNSSSSTKEYVAISFDISLHHLLLVLGAKRLLEINMQRTCCKTCHTLFYVCNAIIAVPGKNPNGWNNEHFVDLILGQHFALHKKLSALEKGCSIAQGFHLLHLPLDEFFIRVFTHKHLYESDKFLRQRDISECIYLICWQLFSLMKEQFNCNSQQRLMIIFVWKYKT